MSASDEHKARISRNYLSIRNRMRDAAVRAGRLAEEITLVAVTKTVGIAEIRVLWELGVTHLAENRVEVAREKIPALNIPVHWHMIGTVQKRKAIEIVQLFDVVDSVDRLSSAETLHKRCEQLDKQLNVLLEVNVSGETSKHGFSAESLEAALAALRVYDRLRVAGLMTMAPFGAPDDFLRTCFRRLRELGQENGLRELSMGMSEDFEIAIEEGATQVRIGSALFA